MNPFAAMWGDKMAMRPFVIFFDHLFIKKSCLFYLISSVIPVTGELSTPDALDLQVEYWTVAPRTELGVEKVERSTRKEMKCSLKMSLHLFRVFRGQSAVPAAVSSLSAADPASLLSMVIVTPEKKQKSEYRCRVVVIIGNCHLALSAVFCCTLSCW